MKKSFEELVELIESECKKHDVTLLVEPGKFVQLGSLQCGGYFDSDERVLTAAIGHEDGKILLAHEYCHLTQWVDKLPLWDIAGESLQYLNPWLEGEDFPNMDKHLANARDLELDNEIRTTRLVEEYDLGISVEDYIKKSNAYVLFYNWLAITRRWSVPGNSPYTNARILELMSDKFDMNYQTLDPNIRKIFEEENI